MFSYFNYVCSPVSDSMITRVCGRTSPENVKIFFRKVIYHLYDCVAVMSQNLAKEVQYMISRFGNKL
jgi:hypothetical protein